MNFDEYQKQASLFAEYDEKEYPVLGLAEETGEFIGIFAKTARGDDIEARYGGAEGLKEALTKEAGDILWQLSQCLKEVGLSMQDAAEMNLKKLTDRQARGVIKGQGDER